MLLIKSVTIFVTFKNIHQLEEKIFKTKLLQIKVFTQNIDKKYIYFEEVFLVQLMVRRSTLDYGLR